MTFLVDEKVSCVIIRSNPLVNEESHCTASFHGVRGCYLNLLVCTEFVSLYCLVRTKQTPRKEDKTMNVGDFVKQPSKWEGCS